MATKKSSTLKAKDTRRAAKPADGDKQLADALHDIFHKLDSLGDPLRGALGAANACELIADDQLDIYVQDALHAVAHHAQDRIDTARIIVESAMDIIRNTKEHRAAIAEGAARLAAAEEGGAS